MISRSKVPCLSRTDLVRSHAIYATYRRPCSKTLFSNPALTPSLVGLFEGPWSVTQATWLCPPTTYALPFNPPLPARFPSQLSMSKNSWRGREREHALLQHHNCRLPECYGKFPAIGGGGSGGVHVHALLSEGGDRGVGRKESMDTETEKTAAAS